jgi:hypothetical protein
MFNGSYSSIEILKIGLESVHLIKSNWNQIDCTLKKKNSIDYENNFKKLVLPRRELNPGLLGESQLS